MSNTRFALARTRVLAVLICASALITALAGCDAGPTTKQVLIENVHVVDPVSGLSENRQVLVEDGTIAAVADASAQLALNTQVERFDGKGRYLMPGLWDMHVHFVYDPTLTHDLKVTIERSRFWSQPLNDRRGLKTIEKACVLKHF